LEKLENSDVLVVNFGPINQEVSEFLDQYQHNMYSPNLIFEAIARGKLCLDERLISVNRLLCTQAKSKCVFSQKQGSDRLVEPYKFHFINYKCSDIASNLMEFSKKLILVRFRLLSVHFISITL